MTRALITGGTGFVGSNIALRLAERHWDVRILERPDASRELLEGGPFEFVTGDVLEPETLPPTLRGIDVIFHAAGVVDYWKQGVERMYQVNVEGTRNVMEAALRSKVERVVHTSSTAAMGIHPDVLVDESYTFNGKPERFVYGHSKFQAEEIVLEYVRKGLPALIVNPTTVIGPRDVRKVSSGMVVEVVKHCAPPLIPPGGINIVPICDAAQGHIEAAVKGHVGERYILGGENMTHVQLYQTIAQCGRLRHENQGHAALAGGFHRRADRYVAATDQRPRAFDRHPPAIGIAVLLLRHNQVALGVFNMPKTPLRTTIGRTYEWYEAMGEFEHVYRRP